MAWEKNRKVGQNGGLQFFHPCVILEHLFLSHTHVCLAGGEGLRPPCNNYTEDVFKKRQTRLYLWIISSEMIYNFNQQPYRLICTTLQDKYPTKILEGLKYIYCY